MRSAMPRKVIAAIVFALPAVAFAASGDAEVGRKKSEPCKACHGEAGVSASPDFPNIAGQHADYITAVLNHYKNGKRKNPIMQGQVANLTQKDILDLAAYYSKQKGLRIVY
jgi:cytochrome c553